MKNDLPPYSNQTTLLSSLLGQKIMVIGHRGLGISSRINGTLPENTLPAFQMAFIDGADMVELDITLTWDNEIVVFHDDLLERTTNGIGDIQNFTLETLRQLDAGKGTIWEGKNIRINTLNEIIFFLLKNNLQHSLNIEVKPYQGSRRLDRLYRQTILNKLLRILDQYNVTDRVIISSFDIRIMIMLRKKRPDIITALLAEGNIWTMKKLIRAAEKLGINGIHPEFAMIKNANEVKVARDQGLFVQPYTLDNEKEYLRALYLGVTGIITDFPEKLRTFLNSNF